MLKYNSCSARTPEPGTAAVRLGVGSHVGYVSQHDTHTHANISTQTDSCSVVRRQCANRCHGPDRHISDNRWRLPSSLETRKERVVMDHS